MTTECSAGKSDADSIETNRDPSSGSFVKKLYNMVESEPGDVVEWIRDGTAFHIKDTKILSEEYLPKYFRHSRFSSLIRQLNFYSFYKVTEGNQIIYQHSFFRKGRPDLLHHIKRRGAGKAKDPLLDRLEDADPVGQESCVSPTSKAASSIDTMSPAHKPGVPLMLSPPPLSLEPATNSVMKRALEISEDKSDEKKIRRDSMIGAVGRKEEKSIEDESSFAPLDIKDFLTDDCTIIELPASTVAETMLFKNIRKSKEALMKWSEEQETKEKDIEAHLYFPSYCDNSLWTRPLSPLASPEGSTWLDAVF